MVRDSKKLELATHYRKRGYSYSEISKICGISKGTVSAWLAKKAFSKQVRTDNVIKAGRDNAKRLGLLNKAKNSERAKRYKEALKSADIEYKHYRDTPLFIAGLLIYHNLGDNNHSSQIRLSSADPEAQRIFTKFAKNYLGATGDTIKFWLLLYPDVKETEAIKFWSKCLNLKTARFYKSQIVQGQNKRQTLQFGVLNTIIGSTVLKLKLKRWIGLALKELS